MRTKIAKNHVQINGLYLPPQSSIEAGHSCLMVGCAETSVANAKNARIVFMLSMILWKRNLNWIYTSQNSQTLYTYLRLWSWDLCLYTQSSVSVVSVYAILYLHGIWTWSNFCFIQWFYHITQFLVKITEHSHFTSFHFMWVFSENK